MSPSTALDVSISQVRLMFNPDAIHSVAVASNWLYLAASPATVVRINLDNPSAVEDVQIPRKHIDTAGSIKQLYIDESGSQLLAVTQWNEHFYFADHKQSRKEFKYLSKLKGNSTTAAMFFGKKRGVALLGTSAGSVIEMSVDSSANETYFRRDMRYASELWKYTRKEPVRAIIMHGNELIISVGRDLLGWDASSVGASSASNAEIFRSVLNEQAETLESVPADSSGRIKGLTHSPNSKALAAVFGESHVGFRNAGEWRLLEVARASRLLLTNYHIFVLHTNEPTMTVVNMVSENVETVVTLPTTDTIRGVSQDHKEGTQWLYTSSDLYEMRLPNEPAVIWQALVDAKKFEEALDVAESKAARNRILQRYGEYELAEGDSHKGAALLGQSDAPLEAAALIVMERDESALADLLGARLKHTKLKAQRVIITSWLAELGDAKAFKLKPVAEYDTATMLQILKSKGHFEDYLRLLVDTGAIDEAISFRTANEQWPEALELLRQSEHKPSVYRHASILLMNVPRQTVESWMRIANLDPVLLIPSLVSYATTYRGPTAENQAIRYLKFLIVRKGNTETQVYNALVTCMCLNDESEDSLMSFLKDYAPRFSDHDLVLRVCLKYKRQRPAVFIYILMGLYEEAVMLCLNAGTPEMLDLAVDVADKQVTMNDELRKYLLREVAKRMIVIRGAEATALKFIKLLRVDDLLSQFPDFDTLNDLAPEIVRSLEQTNNKLSLLNADIDESLNASQDMQQEIADFKKRSVLIEPGEGCQICDYPVVTRKFYVFPCQHAFHADCLGAYREKLGLKIDAGERDEDPLAKECVLCSETNIKTIDQPLDEDF